MFKSEIKSVYSQIKADDRFKENMMALMNQKLQKKGLHQPTKSTFYKSQQLPRLLNNSLAYVLVIVLAGSAFLIFHRVGWPFSPMSTSTQESETTQETTVDLAGQERFITVKIDPKMPLRGSTQQILDQDYISALQQTGHSLLIMMREKSPGENLLISPLSLSMAFSMATMGAAGETQQEMLAALGFSDMTMSFVIQQNKRAFENIYRDEETLEVLLANSIWCLNGYPFHQSFLDSAATNFFASIRSVSQNDAVKPLVLINRWASDHTNGKIPEVLQELDPDAAMVLMNAVYFLGQWEMPFDSKLTNSQPFTRRDGQVVQADMLSGYINLRIFQTADELTIALPYKGNMAMVLSMHNNDDSRDADLDFLIPDKLNWPAWKETSSIIYLPKFNFSSQMDLKTYMQELGMNKAFVSGEADFSNLSPDWPGLYINTAIQKTAIIVTEEGTEAAAVTVERMSGGKPQEIRFDKPFWFAVVDSQGVPLFTGAVEDPSVH